MKLYVQIVVSLSLLLFFLGCKASGPASAQNMGPGQAWDWLRQNPQAQLIDVRTPAEFGQEHLAGAKLIPLQEMETRLPEIHKNKPVMLYCLKGGRSSQALQFLKDRGFKDLFQIEGGITAWKEKGLPVETSSKN